MHMTLSRVATGWETKMLSTTCAKKPLKPSSNSNLMECLFQEQNKARFTKELSEDSLLGTEKSKLIVPAQWQIEQDTQCYILSSADHLPTTAHSSSNISHWI